jgi:hypothetical protein
LRDQSFIVTEKLIGGVQGLGIESVSSIGRRLLASRNGLYYNARSALYAIIQISTFKRIWLPSYLCDTVLLPFEKAGLEFQFYPITDSLQADFNDIPVASGEAVLLISYFGIPLDPTLYQMLKSKGAVIIEDFSQAFYLEPHLLADFTVYSLRKFFAVPDGGIVIANRCNGLVVWPYLNKGNASITHTSIEAISGRALFDAGISDTREWFKAFQAAESRMPTDLSPMSQFTRMQVAGAINFNGDGKRRVANFDYLLSKLGSVALIKDRKRGVPLGFHIVLENRNEVREKLFDHKIYPPIHWAIQGVVPDFHKESHELAKRIMTLPCDARYDIHDMERIVDVLMEEC